MTPNESSPLPTWLVAVILFFALIALGMEVADLMTELQGEPDDTRE